MSTPAELTIGSAPSAREAGLWAAAVVVVVGAHAAFAYAFHAMTPLEPRPDATEQALVIELAALPVSTPEAVESESLAEVEPAERLQPVEDAVEPVVEEPETLAAVAPTETVEEVRPDTVAPVETAVEAEPVRPEPLVAEAVEPEMLRPVEIEPLRPVDPEAFVDTEMAEIVESDVVVPVPEPKPVVKPVPKTETPPKKTAREKQREVAEPKPRKQAARAEAKPKPAPRSEASQKAQASRAPTVSPARWQSKVLAWINKHKRYPKAARSRGEQGTVRVSFAINASGGIVSARVSRSSGSAELDQAALDMVRRASPVPAPPPEIAGSRLNLSLPVRFDLR